MHDIRHENLCAFIGIVDEDVVAGPSNNSVYLAWENCLHGSLSDVIALEALQMDWDFKLALISDLVKGMKYLHDSPISVHGWLTSRSCVVDSRWILKVSDFGLQKVLLSMNEYEAKKYRPKHSQDFLWASPERLRLGFAGAFMSVSQASDVYSFAIIACEIIARKPIRRLFGSLGVDEVLDKVRGKHGNYASLRPRIIRPDDVPEEAVALISRCWSEKPEERLSFRNIATCLRRFPRTG